MISNMTNSLLSNFANPVQAARVTVLHEDLPTALCAKALFDCVVPQLDGAELELDYWRCDALREPALREDSARTSQASAIIVFSIRNRKTLPPEIKDWLNEWMAGRADHPCAFVALIAGGRSDDDENHPVLRQLRRVAEKSGADFFCEHCEAPPAAACQSRAEPAWSTVFAAPKRTDCWRVNA